MPALALDVRLDGFAEPIGALVRDDRGAVSFTYRPDYLARTDAVRLSLSMPLDDAPVVDVIARPFFDNLLQERDGALSDVMAREGLARDDIAGLLYHLGKDCTGALSVLPAGAPPVKVPGDYATDYLPLAPERLEAIVRSLHERRRLPEDVQDPSPLAGVQSKIALTILPDGRFAEPVPGSGAPTTHILKVPDQDHLNEAILEAAALELSRACGFATCNAVVMPIAGIDTLLVTRFDRALDGEGRVVRLHQEDFAQALGLPAQLKYERRGVPGRRFDVPAITGILGATDDPIGGRETFIRATLFDLMVGNTDGHAKNFALMHGAGGGIRLAPRYDIVPTRLDAALTDELAYSIGGARRLQDVTSEAFVGFLADLGIAGKAAGRRLRDANANDIAGRLAALVDALETGGMKRFADLVAGNIRTLLGGFGLKVPDAVEARDTFVARGGGWLMS